MTDTLILHEFAKSGNCYKIRLTAAHVGAILERREYDILRGETRTPVFLETVNANGRIPVLQIGSRFLPESNAAIYWLADGSALIPADRFDRADMLRWMSWEQYNHEPNIGTMRFFRAFVGSENLSEAQKASIPFRIAAGDAALKLMDDHLAAHDWFVPRRHRALRLHPRRRGGRVRPVALSRDPALGRPRCRAARACHNKCMRLASECNNRPA
jgi:glutathione S-transferase